MTLLDILKQAASATGNLLGILEKAKAALPDLADEIDQIIAQLSEAVTPENLSEVAVSAVAELADIAKGKIVSKDHPSSLA